MIDSNGWGAPETPPAPRITRAGRRGAELVAAVSDGRLLTFAPTLIAGEESLAVQAEGESAWRRATDPERQLLGTHDVAVRYLFEQGSVEDVWIGAPYVPQPPPALDALTDDELDRILGSDAPRHVEPPNGRSVWERLADEDRWFEAT